MQPINKPPLKLLFGNAELNGPGIQTTVRVGPKWRDLIGNKRLKNVPVIETSTNEQVGLAEITGCLFGSFKDYGAVGAEFNNSESNQTVEGLAESLAEDYPDFDPETSQVTVVFFKPVAETVTDESEDDSADERVSEDADGNTLIPGVGVFPEDRQPVPPLDGAESINETEAVEKTEESSDGSTEETDSGAEESVSEKSNSETGESSESEESSDS